jgi:hypothetical protein
MYRNTRINFSTIAFIALFVAFTTACGSEKWVSINVTERSLSFPPAYYEKLVYVSSQVIGFTADSRAPKEEQISFAYEGDKETTLFRPEDDPKCTRYTYFYIVNLLPDGRLGLLKECNDDSAATAYLSTNRSILAYD